MKKLLLILLCLPIIGFGQSWERFISIADSNSYSCIYGEQTQDGGYIITGGVSNSPTSLGSPNDHLFLLKIDHQGDTVWNKTYPNINGKTIGRFVRQTFGGGYVISAYEVIIIDSIYTHLLIKTNSIGDTLWTKYYDCINSMIGGGYIEQTTDSGFIVKLNEYIIKTDSQGDTLWSENYEGTPGYARNINQTSDGGYIFISSVLNLSTFTFETYLTKLNSLGDTIWMKLFNYDAAVSVEQTSDGGYIISGNKNFTLGQPTIPYLTKTDSLGNIIWTKTYSYYQGVVAITSSQQTSDGGYISSIMQMDTTQITDETDILLLKTNSLGDTIWTNRIKVGDSLQDLTHIKQTIDGGYFLVASIEGRTTKEIGKGIIYLIKTDGNGNITSTFNIPTINTSKGELLKIVDIFGRETKGTNQPLIYIFDDGTVEKRIVIE
jgi:hypothetical protein